MKTLLLFFGLVSYGFSQSAPSDTLTALAAAKRIGSVCWVKAVVAGAREASDDSKPHYINLDKEYPNQDLTIVAFGNFKEKYGIGIAQLKGKTILVRGMVSDYKGRPQIKSPTVLKVLE